MLGGAFLILCIGVDDFVRQTVVHSATFCARAWGIRIRE